VAVPRGRPRSARFLVLGLVSLSLLIITIDYREGPDGPLARAGAAAHAAMAPLQNAVTSVTRPIGNFFSGLVKLPSLEAENRRLQEQVDDLNTKVAGVDQLQLDNATLSDLLGLKARLDPAAIPAVVIANGLSDFEQVITIDHGSKDGVKLNMPVVTGSAESPRLVGHVISVTGHAADVELIIDRDAVTAGIVDQVQQVGTLSGQGDEDLRMDDITKPLDLTGSPPQVFTVAYSVGGGQHGLYPPNILIGEVSRVYEDDNQLQTSVSVRPAVNFSSLAYVLVLATPQRGGDAT
jgi:rod shape-determining protein MreC